MTLTQSQSGRLHAILVEALSIMDSAPYVPTDLPADPVIPPTEPPPNRVRKPASSTRDLDAEVYDRLLAAGPEPQTARGLAEALREDAGSIKRSLRRLQAAGRAKILGSKRGARYLPLSLTGHLVNGPAVACEPDLDDIL